MDEELISKADKALSKAKIGLMRNKHMAFITSVCLNMQTKWSEDIPTACTDGKSITYNPHFFLSLPKELQLSVVVHETWHPVLKHMCRIGARNPKKYNAAGDYVINQMIEDAGLPVGDGWLLDHQYKGMSTDQVYDLLPDDQEPQWEDVVPAEAGQAKAADEYMDKVILKAVIQAKAFGSLDSVPQDILDHLDAALNPKLPWQTILRRYVSAYAKDDYSWKRPNKRYAPKHYLPSLYSEKLGEVVVFYDLSGSVTDRELQHFTTETISILNSMRPTLITIVTFDIVIRDVFKVRTAHDVAHLKLKGRGGTKINDCMEWLAKRKPVISVVFSDGEFGFTNVVDPKCPIVWAIHNKPDFNAPFGKVIEYKMEI